jgi:zinc transport system substrate-binding protein
MQVMIVLHVIKEDVSIMFKNRVLAVLFFVLAAIGLYGCQNKVDNGSSSPGKVVITTLFPLYDFARTIAGDRMEVQLLLPPGVEPHHFEPRPDDLTRINRAALFIYIGPFMEPWADRVIAGVDRKKVRVVAAADGVSLMPAMAHAGEAEDHDHNHGHSHQLERMDPHVWLDFNADKRMVANLLAAFIAVDPTGTEQYRRRAADLTEQLESLDKRYVTGLANCGSRVLFHGGHAAFGYLAKRYDLDYQAAAGVTAELEATPRRLAELIQQVRKNKVKAIYSEELVSPRVARTIAGETGATVLKLHGAHNVGRDELEQGVTFIQLMDENLKNLEIGLACRN